MKYSIDDDITVAATLPGKFYCDPTVYAAQLERVFTTSWQFVPVQPDDGEIVPATLMEGSLDEPIVFVQSDGETRVLSNVCTHRGAVIVTEAQKGKVLRCGYHGRCFDKRGAFLSASGFQGAKNFPRPADDLPALSLSKLGPLNFVSIDPSVSFEDWTAPLREKMPWFDWTQLPARPTTTESFTFDANWALYCENFLEGFHVPFVHPGLNTVLDLDGYDHALFPRGTLQTAKPSGDEPTFPDGTSAHYYWFFPNIMLNFYPWGLSINVVKPLGLGRTRVDFYSYVSDPSKCDVGAGADLGTVEMEDEAIVQLVQRGVRARLYDRGRYAPQHEQGVHLFHRLLLGKLS
jgi:choline monooxygenase